MFNPEKECGVVEAKRCGNCVNWIPRLDQSCDGCVDNLHYKDSRTEESDGCEEFTHRPPGELLVKVPGTHGRIEVS
jgi:predicted amidophosphoribosyltransferase